MIKKAWYFVFSWMWYGLTTLLLPVAKTKHKTEYGNMYTVKRWFDWMLWRSEYMQDMAFLGQYKYIDGVEVSDTSNIPASATKYWPYDYND